MEGREPITHELKTWPEYFCDVKNGSKTFEIRKFDRPYRVGDILLLREFLPSLQEYTGDAIKAKITYILDLTYLPGDNVPHFSGYACMSIVVLPEED